MRTNAHWMKGDSLRIVRYGLSSFLVYADRGFIHCELPKLVAAGVNGRLTWEYAQ